MHEKLSELDARYRQATDAFNATWDFPILEWLSPDSWYVALIDGSPEVVIDQADLIALVTRGRFAAPLPPTVVTWPARPDPQ